MIKVIGVRFRTAGKIYFFDPLQFEINRDDHVIVETARGIEFGTVVTGITEVADEKVVQPLKPVIRIANRRDLEQEAANREKEKEAFRICLEKIRSHGLEMKLIDAEYTFDNNKVLFYFTADGRIDFRELVKDLAGVFKTRIELRQIGVRDETKIVGGIGICGRALCCHSYLADFVPVSIKMAKEQNLSLNPAKISGVCGRLMCCLKNEEETYEELNRRLPNIGDYVTIEGGMKGEVQSVNVLRQLVKVVVDAGDEKEIKEYPVEKLHFRRKHSRKEKMELTQEELDELERLEEEEWQKKEQAGRAKAEEEQRQSSRNRQRQNAGQKSSGAEENRRPGQRGDESRRQPAGEESRRPGQRGDENRRQSGREDRRAGQGDDGSGRTSHKWEDSRRQGTGDGDAQGQYDEGTQRKAGQEGGSSGRKREEGQQSQGTGSGQRQGGQRYGSQRQSGQRGAKAGNRQEQRNDEERAFGQHQGGKNRRDGKKRQDNRESRDRRNRNDSRNRHDNRERQE